LIVCCSSENKTTPAGGGGPAGVAWMTDRMGGGKSVSLIAEPREEVRSGKTG